MSESSIKNREREIGHLHRLIVPKQYKIKAKMSTHKSVNSAYTYKQNIEKET